MKTMTCAQLGGPETCNEKFHAETFEKMADFSKQHGMEMFQKGDEEHIKVMNKMKESMGDPDAMKKYMENKKKIFDSLPEDHSQMKNPVGWFEIAVTDLDRAEKFYKDLLGLNCDRQEKKENGITMSWFSMEMNEYGSAGTLVLGENFTPSHEGTLVYFSCSSVGETLKKAEAMDVKILLPKTDIGEHGFIAWLEDSEGNRIAIHSRNS
jgi:uncharacterized protein